MKQIILVRHAKTISHGYDQDFDRTLTDRGRDDAERICRAMIQSGTRPDLIISSPAVRTTQTTRIFADLLGYPLKEIRYEKKLYTGMLTPTFRTMVQEVDDRHTTILVTGHNPTIYFFAEYLLSGFSFDVPTCSTLVIAFDISQWSELQEHSGRLLHRWIPDLL